jgi:hypothetical protein
MASEQMEMIPAGRASESRSASSARARFTAWPTCAPRLSITPSSTGLPAPTATLVRTVATRQLSFSSADIATPARVKLILGGQGVRVRLAGSGTTYDPATHVLSSSVTVENLLAGPMGTSDGVAVRRARAAVRMMIVARSPGAGL